jgi:hypothetical protein
MVAASFRLFAGEDRPPGLGSGAPGLRIIWNATNQYIIYNDLTYVQSYREKADWLPEKWQIQVLTERNFDIQALTAVPRYETFNEEDLYPFDEEKAFTCMEASKLSSNSDTNGWPRKTWVYSINITNGEIILVSRDVYALARSRYGLTTNQLFLGKIGANIFYCANRDLRKVYYRTTEEPRATHYFKLPRNVVDLDGVTRAVENTNKDVAVCGTVSQGWFDWFDPAAFHSLSSEFSFKDAKRVKGK